LLLVINEALLLLELLPLNSPQSQPATMSYLAPILKLSLCLHFWLAPSSETVAWVTSARCDPMVSYYLPWCARIVEKDTDHMILINVLSITDNFGERFSGLSFQLSVQRWSQMVSSSMQLHRKKEDQRREVDEEEEEEIRC
jgi:hypothetical protein